MVTIKEVDTDKGLSLDVKKELLYQLKSFSEMRRAIASYFTDIVQVSDLNMAFVCEMLKSSEKNMESISNAQKKLKNIRENSESIVSNVENSGQSINSGRCFSKESLEAMQEANESIQKLISRFNNIKLLFSEVNEATQKVLAQIEAVEDISELTNLLALNASIEAARAGRHGKGFSVVAKGVRKLADKSKSITQDISSFVGDLNDKISSSILSLKEYENIQDLVQEKIRGTGERLKASNEMLETVDIEIGQIKDLVRNQSQNTDEIYKEISGVNDMAKFNTSSSNHIISNMENQSMIMDDVSSIVKEAGLFVQRQEEKLSGEGIIKRELALLTVGHDVAYPPWVYLSGGRAEGISVDIMRKIGESLDNKLEFFGDQWGSIYPALLEKKLDIVLNVGWPNDFLKDEPVFVSNAYASFETTIFCLKSKLPESGSITQAALAGKRIAVQRGSYVDQDVNKLGCEIIHVENDIQGIVQLIWEKVDGIATDRKVGNYISQKFFKGDIVPATTGLGRKDVVCLLRNDLEELREQINAVISAMKHNQEIDRIIEGS